MDSSIGELMLKMSKVMSSIADRVAKLELMAHAPRKFVTCEDCKQQIREIKNGKEK